MTHPLQDILFSTIEDGFKKKNKLRTLEEEVTNYQRRNTSFDVFYPEYIPPTWQNKPRDVLNHSK